MTFSIERAIKSSDEDILDRKKFANNLVLQITSYEENECLTIGLIGGWGTGKSSILNMVKEYLNNDNTELIEFTPWYFSGREQLISDFFQVLSEKIDSNNNNQMEELAYDLNKYSKILKPLSLIPQFTVVTSVLEKGAKGVSEFLNEYTKDISLDNLKKNINDKLREYPKKLVVFIDEIDRLNKNEMCEIFQLVRALGDFENIIYLLAFDDEKVYKIADLDKVYLEKIINIPISVPNMQIKKINDILLNELSDLIGVTESEEEHWKEIYENLFKDYFVNLRQIKRFVNIIKFNQFMMREVNKIDFVVISFLQYFEPKAYDFIKKNGIHLCWCKGFGNTRKPKDYDKTIMEGEKLIENTKLDLKKLLTILFSEKRKSNNKQINNTRFFSCYFEYTLDEHVYCYEERMKLMEVKEQNEVYEAIEKIGVFDYLENVIETCRELDKDQLILIIECVFKLIPSLEKKESITCKNNQKECFRKLEYLLSGFSESDTEYINRIISGLEISGKIEFTSVVNYCVKLKNHFVKNAKMEKLNDKLRMYITDNYSRDIFECFDKLSLLGIDIKKYVKIIIQNPDTLFCFLEHILFLVDVKQDPIYDIYGKVIDVDEYEITELCIEDINKYTSQEELISIINKLSKDIRDKHKHIINQVMNPRRKDDVIEEMKAYYGNAFED